MCQEMTHTHCTRDSNTGSSVMGAHLADRRSNVPRRPSTQMLQRSAQLPVFQSPILDCKTVRITPPSHGRRLAPCLTQGGSADHYETIAPTGAAVFIGRIPCSILVRATGASSNFHFACEQESNRGDREHSADHGK